MMQFVCTARSADDEDYRPLAETPLTLDFAYDHGVSTLADPAVWQVTLTNNAAAPWRGVVKLELCVAYDAPRFSCPDSSTAAIAARPRSALTTATQGCGQVHRSFLHRLGGWSALIASATPQPSCWTADGGMGSAAPYFVRQNGVLQPWQPGRGGNVRTVCRLYLLTEYGQCRLHAGVRKRALAVCAVPQHQAPRSDG